MLQVSVREQLQIPPSSKDAPLYSQSREPRHKVGVECHHLQLCNILVLQACDQGLACRMTSIPASWNPRMTCLSSRPAAPGSCPTA